MESHGHAKADQRNLALHEAALAKLERKPELLEGVMALLDRWLLDTDHRPSWPYLRQWREMLTVWPFQRMAARVLDPDSGQVLRQCSPLGPTLTPRERSAVFMEANRAPHPSREILP